MHRYKSNCFFKTTIINVGCKENTAIDFLIYNDDNDFIESQNINNTEIVMCLAVPMQLVEKDGDRGMAELGGVKRNINLMLVPEAEVGNYVIVHAGCAIEVLNEKEALNTIALFQEMAEKNNYMS